MSKKTAGTILGWTLTALWIVLVSAHAAMIYPGVPSESVLEKVAVTVIYTGMIGFTLLIGFGFLDDWLKTKLGWNYRIIHQDGKIVVLPPE